MPYLPRSVYFIKSCLWFFFSVFSISTTAQQLSIFTQYRDLQTVINPGALPIDYFVYDYEPTVFIGATFRDQWTDGVFQNAPRTLLLHLDYISTNRDGDGLSVGGYILHDQNGIFETTGGYGKLAAIIGLYDGELSLGLNVGLVQNRLQFRKAEQRPINIEDNFSGIFLDVGAGIFYRYEFDGREYGKDDFIYTGLSVPQVIGSKNNFSPTFIVNRIPHFFYTFGWLHYFNEDSFIEPSLWLKYVPNTPINIDLNFQAQLENNLTLMAGWSAQRQGHLLNVAVGLSHKLDNIFLKIGAGFSFALGAQNNRFGATQEYHFHYNW